MTKNSNISNISNVASEDVTITPDMPLINTDEDSSFTPTPNSVYEPNILISRSNASPQVTPDVGIHFLYNDKVSDEVETVDLTKNERTQKKPVKRKRKDGKKGAIKNAPPTKKFLQSATILPKTVEKNKQILQKTVLRQHKSSIIEKLVPPKRQSNRIRLLSSDNSKQTKPKKSDTATNTVKVSNMLKKHNLPDSFVVTERLFIPLFQCPICNKLFPSILKRENHETFEHHLHLELSRLSVNSVQELHNASNTEQEEFLMYFKLAKKSSPQATIMDTLASRPNLLKALKTIGNTVSQYKCDHCEYQTSRMFILWAHTYIYHINHDYLEKKSCTYCFLCNCVLRKRVKCIKHTDRCINSQLRLETTSAPVKKFTCDICKTILNSLSQLEIHLINHIDINNKCNS